MKLLTTDIILRYMREKIQTIVNLDKNNSLHILDVNTSKNKQDIKDATLTDKSLVFDSDDDEQRAKAPLGVSLY